MAEKIKGNPEQSYRRARRRKQLGDRLTDADVKVAEGALGAGLGSAAGVADAFFERNEFKPGFYDQKDKPPITAETMYGKGTKRGFESPIVDPDTSMMQNMAEGGSVKGQKAIQVKKKIFKGVF
jgi:hypothetical protein